MGAAPAAPPRESAGGWVWASRPPSGPAGGARTYKRDVRGRSVFSSRRLGQRTRPLLRPSFFS